MQQTIKILNLLLGGAIIIVLGLVGTRMYNPVFLGDHSEWNELPANIAAVLFLIVLLPGALQRMGVPTKLLKYFIVYRRTLGIAMYFFALLHFLFLIDYLPWFSDGLVENFDALTASGIAAVIILLPVLLTSNNISLRLLGRWWKVLQRITYLVIPLIAVHLWQTDKLFLAILYIVTTIIILISYFMKTIKKGASPLFTSLSALGVIAFAVGLSYLALKFLFKNPQDAKARKQLEENTAQLEQHEKEKAALQKEIDRKEGLLVEEQKKVEEFERIEKEKADEQAKKKVEEDRIKAEEEAKSAEAARIAALTDYRSGSYTGVGNYSTDKGDKTERIDVKLSITDDIVVSVEIISHAKASKSQKYVGKFKKDIAGIVVGKKVNSLDVHGIGGASDTSTGFRTALASIKSQARQ